jgi:hypothetical protein
MTNSRPEHDLLLCVARRELGPDEIETVRRLVQQEPDWDYLLTIARSHGFVPLVCKHLNETAKDLIPGRVLSILKRESVTNTQSVLHLVSKALKVIKLFDENKIASAFFKGPMLAEQAYGDLALRQAGDIDILITEEKFPQAKKLLESLGYEMYPQLNTRQQASHLSFHCEIPFVRDDWFTVVDLHWRLSPQSFTFGLTDDEVMTRLRSVSFAGTQVQTFSNEDLVLYLAMHGAKHHWLRLEWIASLAEVVRGLEPSSWPIVVERAFEARATKILALALLLGERVSELKVPAGVLPKLDADNAMQRLAQTIWNDLFDPNRTKPVSTDSHIFNLKIMDRKRDAFSSALRAIFVPTLSDWEALLLPASLHSLYYVYRPLRLSKAYSASLLRKFTHKQEVSTTSR